MSDIISSQAFQEFLQMRCEEYTETNIKILELERKLLPMLSDEAKNLYLEIEELTMMLQNRTDNLLIY